MNVVFLDCTQDYGYQFAARNSKVEFMIRGLRVNNVRTSIINGIFGSKFIKNRETMTDKSVGEVITYPFKGVVLGPLLNKSLLREDLKRLYRPDEKNIVILAAPYLHLYMIYNSMAKNLGYRTVVISDEWLPTIKSKYWIQNRMSEIYASTFGDNIDGILPISEYIIERIRKFGRPWLKTPALADFNNEINTGEHNGGLVYCGYTEYFRVIRTVIHAYAKFISSVKTGMPFTLVLTGSEKGIQAVRDEIECLGLSQFVKVRTALPHSELYSLYRDAKGLIIPLDPSHEQDKARFAQKIAEYVSSGSPIITNAVGVIPYYFSDRQNAIICDYSIDSFAETFAWICANPDQINKIGQGGYDVGRREFNYETYGHKLYGFLNELK